MEQIQLGERGISLIDSAPVYGFGRSEEIVGKALAGVDAAAAEPEMAN